MRNNAQRQLAKEFIEGFFSSFVHDKPSIYSYFDENSSVHLFTFENKHTEKSSGTGIIEIKKVYSAFKEFSKIRIDNFDIQSSRICTKVEQIETVIVVVNGGIQFKSESSTKLFTSIFHLKKTNNKYVIVHQLFKLEERNLPSFQFN